MNEADNQTVLPIGMRIEHYELLKVLGCGGFGITYLALDKKRNRPVVIKEFFPKSAAIRQHLQTQVSLLSGDSEADFEKGLQRFENEALTLSSFKHPNIVEVIAMFPANGTAYFVMEHIEGQSLEDEQCQRNRAFTETELQRELFPVLNGLAELHQRQLLHLDVKPDNILTSKYGEPLLIDFGGARYATGQDSKDISFMVATEGYAPPEQYSLQPIQTAATDLYAFGMTLYHLMAPTAIIPSSQDRQHAMINEMSDPLVPVREVAPGYSEALYRVVESCTRMAARKRPQSVEAIWVLLGDSAIKPVEHDQQSKEDEHRATDHSSERNKSESHIKTRPITKAPEPVTVNYAPFPWWVVLCTLGVLGLAVMLGSAGS